MALYRELESGGTPVKTMRVDRGHILVDAKDMVVTDEYGEAFTYATQAEATAALERSVRGGDRT